MEVIQGMYSKYWKCALQVNPASYITYRGTEQSLSEEEYNEAILSSCLEEKINVIGLADHGNVDGVDSLRDRLKVNGITVFPGFEVASSEKIHFVCLFDENKTVQELDRILGRLELLDPKDGISPSNLSAEQLISKVTDIGGFIYAAHSTHDDGVLKRRMNHVWQRSKLQAAQIPGSIEDLKGIENDFYRKVFLNKDQNYLRESQMVAINAADVAKPDDLRKNNASCYIKMTSPSFEAFKQAFLDPESRVRIHSDLPESHASSIDRIEFIDGYLDGLNASISNHLNAVIGGRGTGKSTLIECIRFALDKQPFKPTKQSHDKIVKENLGKDKGMVKLHITSHVMNGEKYIISRRFGDSPIVTDTSGTPLPFSPIEVLPSLDLYGQNEIFEMVRDETERNKLIERFTEQASGEVKVIDELKIKLAKNREKILEQLSDIADIQMDVEKLPTIEQQVEQFKKLGIEEHLKVVPVLEKEKTFVSKFTEVFDGFDEIIKEVTDEFPTEDLVSAEDIAELKHTNEFRLAQTLIKEFNQKANLKVYELLELRKLYKEKLDNSLKSVSTDLTQDGKELAAVFKKIPSANGKTGQQIGNEYQELLKEFESLKPKTKELELENKKLLDLYVSRNKLLLELSEERAKANSASKAAIKKVNKKLRDKVRLNLVTEESRTAIVTYLVECNLEGVKEGRLAWVLAKDFSPANLAKVIRSGKDALVGSDYGISESVAIALCKLTESQLLRLEELQIPDTLNIELNISHTDTTIYKDVDSLSTGQQCTAILHLLMLDNRDPLILDQPEDNLDNAFIADHIVSELRKAKTSRQFLFATHNANIPVFGDAEWIGVMQVENEKGIIKQECQGAIDVPNIQLLSANILEGGREAFDQRRLKYGFTDSY